MADDVREANRAMMLCFGWRRFTSALSLHAPMTWSAGSGTALTLVGLFLSECQGHSA